MVSKSRAEAVATVIAPVSSSMAKALPVLPPVMDHVNPSLSPVFPRSTTAVLPVADSETVPVSSSVIVGDMSVIAMVKTFDWELVS